MTRFARFSWAVLATNIAVILWGAFVRATGSGVRGTFLDLSVAFLTITAIGMTKQLPIMMLAVVLAVGVMLVFSGAIVRFVDRNPAVKILALSFLLLIGVLLVAEGFHHEIPKGYVYFAMAFALAVDLLQMRADRRTRTATPQHESAVPSEPEA